MGRRSLYLVVALALVAAFPATAEEWRRVAPADIRVTAGLDWTKAPMGSHWVKWTANFGSRLWVSSWQGGTAGFPRLEILFEEAGPGYHYRGISKVGMEQISGWNFLGNKKLAITGRSSEGGYKTVYFKADEIKCVYFLKSGKIDMRSDTGTSNISGIIHGYYCPNEGADLTRTDVLAVLNTVRIRSRR